MRLDILRQNSCCRHDESLAELYDFIAESEPLERDRTELITPYDNFSKLNEDHDLIKEVVAIIKLNRQEVNKSDQTKWSSSLRDWFSQGHTLERLKLRRMSSRKIQT